MGPGGPKKSLKIINGFDKWLVTTVELVLSIRRSASSAMLSLEND